MSRGSTILTFRINPELHQRMMQALASRNNQPLLEGWTVSDWIKAAIEDKLRHLGRAKKQKAARRQAVRSAYAKAVDLLDQQKVM